MQASAHPVKFVLSSFEKQDKLSSDSIGVSQKMVSHVKKIKERLAVAAS